MTGGGRERETGKGSVTATKGVGEEEMEQGSTILKSNSSSAPPSLS